MSFIKLETKMVFPFNSLKESTFCPLLDPQSIQFSNFYIYSTKKYYCTAQVIHRNPNMPKQLLVPIHFDLSKGDSEILAKSNQHHWRQAFGKPFTTYSAVGLVLEVGSI